MSDLQAKFQHARKILNATLVGRHEEIDLTLIALLSKEHLLLVGAPGSAKSLLCDLLSRWVNSPKFSYLMTKFTDPGELFGPTDVPALVKEGKTQRVINGFAPTAAFLFLDEIFKASSAILNTTLTLLNERRFKCGLQEMQCPLLLCIGASNEWPNDQEGGKELGALFDRFLFRKKVDYVRGADRKELLRRAVDNTPFTAEFEETITAEELQQAHAEARKLPFTKQAKKVLWAILEDLAREGIEDISDRRLVKTITAVRAAAYLDGAEGVYPEHLEVLQHVLWNDPAEQPEKCGKVVCQHANPANMKAAGARLQIESVVRACFTENGTKKEQRCLEAQDKLENIQRDLSALEKTTKVLAARDAAQEAIERVLRYSIGIKED